MEKIGVVGFDTLEQKNILPSCKDKYDITVVNPDDYKLSEKVIDSIFSKILRLGRRTSFIKYLDKLYAITKTTEYKGLIVKISDWHFLTDIHYSYIQISNTNVIFVFEPVKKTEEAEFKKFLKKLGHYRCMQFAYSASDSDCFFDDKFFNLHDLSKENIVDIVKYNFQNKRKSIGIKYGLKRFFQQFKFNFDLLRCYYKIKFKNPYKKYYDSGTKIPKILHFCWFGKGKYPELVEKCIATWKSLFPDFEFKCWDEDNFPFDKYPFAKEALEKKKWAFVSDVARLHALYYEGGIYLDTDIEMLKSLDKFLENGFFTSYESQNLLATGLMGAKPYHPFVAAMLIWYSAIHCDDDYVEIANTKIITKLAKWLYHSKLDGREMILPNDLHVYPRDYFSPPLKNKNEWEITDNSCCIHHFTGMW